MEGRNSSPMSEPPEGVISGESVPRENELDDKEEQAIQEVIGELKAQGKPWSIMTDDEIRGRVKDHLVDNGEIQ